MTSEKMCPIPATLMTILGTTLRLCLKRHERSTISSAARETKACSDAVSPLPEPHSLITLVVFTTLEPIHSPGGPTSRRAHVPCATSSPQPTTAPPSVQLLGVHVKGSLSWGCLVSFAPCSSRASQRPDPTHARHPGGLPCERPPKPRPSKRAGSRPPRKPFARCFNPSPTSSASARSTRFTHSDTSPLRSSAFAKSSCLRCGAKPQI